MLKDEINPYIKLVSIQMELGIKLRGYIPKIAALTDQQSSDFYRRLSHSLTVSIRITLCDKSLSQSEIINRVKWLNEIGHRAITKIDLRPYDAEDTKEFFDMIYDYIEKNDNIIGQLEHCFVKSFNCLSS